MIRFNTRKIYLPLLLIWLVALCLSFNIAHSSTEAETQKQELTELYEKANTKKALWKDVPELYIQAMNAFQEGDIEQFQLLYSSLHFKLTRGLEQAESQTPNPLIPAYLK